jgi:hypothetical protein
VEPRNTLRLAGRIEELLARLRKLHEQIPRHGPNTKRKRETIAEQIAYLKPRAELMNQLTAPFSRLRCRLTTNPHRGRRSAAATGYAATVTSLTPATTSTKASKRRNTTLWRRRLP